MEDEVLSSAKSEAEVPFLVSLGSTPIVGYVIDAPIINIDSLIRQIKYSWKTLDRYSSKQFYSYNIEKGLSQQYQLSSCLYSIILNRFAPFGCYARNLSLLLHVHPDIDYDLILEVIDKLNDRPDEDNHKIDLFCPHSLLAQLATYALGLKYFISVLKRCIAETLRFLFLAHQTRNRVSRNPTPQKKEPPVGGVKIGGEQHAFSRHVAEILYLKQTFTFKQAAW